MIKQSKSKTTTVKIPKLVTPKIAKKLIAKFSARIEKSTIPAPETLTIPEARIARAHKYTQSARKNSFIVQIFGDIAQFYNQRTNNTAALGYGGRPPISREVVEISRDEILAIVGQYIKEEKLAQSQTNLIKRFLEKELQVLQRAPSESLYRGARKDKIICSKSKYIFADNDDKNPHGKETIKLFLKNFICCNPSAPI